MSTHLLVDGYFRNYIWKRIIPTEIVKICIRFFLNIIITNAYPRFQKGDIVLIIHQQCGTDIISGSNARRNHTSEWIVGNDPINNAIQLRSNRNLHSLCISGNKVALDANHNKNIRHFLLKMHFCGSSESEIMLESVMYPGKYISIGPNNAIECGNGDTFCKLKLIHKYEEPEWRTPYLFDKPRVVIIKLDGYEKQYLQSPLNLESKNTGVTSQWAIFPYDNGKRIRIRSMKSGEYLQITPPNYFSSLDVGGNGDKYCQFRVHQYGKKNEVELQSVELGKYIKGRLFPRWCGGDESQDGERCRFKIYQRN